LLEILNKKNYLIYENNMYAKKTGGKQCFSGVDL